MHTICYTICYYIAMSEIYYTTPEPALVFTIALLIVWSLLWKALGLWHAARRGDTGWFIAMLFLNTVGILEIIYLFGVAKMSSKTLGTDTGVKPMKKPTKKSTKKK